MWSSKGLVQEGEHAGKIMYGETQWTVIGDIRNKRYYYLTEHSRRVGLVDLTKLNFVGSKVHAIPPDEVRREDIDDRTQTFS